MSNSSESKIDCKDVLVKVLQVLHVSYIDWNGKNRFRSVAVMLCATDCVSACASGCATCSDGTLCMSCSAGYAPQGVNPPYSCGGKHFIITLSYFSGSTVLYYAFRLNTTFGFWTLSILQTSLYEDSESLTCKLERFRCMGVFWLDALVGATNDSQQDSNQCSLGESWMV